MARAPLDPTSPEAKGSALAAGLAFFQIALVGYLGYELYHTWRSFAGMPGENTLASLALQILFPAWLGIWSYLPTDSLTKATAKIGAVAGAATLVVVTTIVFTTSHAWEAAGGAGEPSFSVWGWLVAQSIAFLAAFGVSEAIRPHLRGFVPLVLTPALRRSLVYLMLSAGAVGAIAVFPIGQHTFSGGFNMPTRAAFAGCAFAALMPLVVSLLARRQRMGFSALFQTPLGLLLALTMLAFASQFHSSSVALNALIVLCTVVVGAIVVRNWRRGQVDSQTLSENSN